MCAESAVLIYGRFAITKSILISELGDHYPHSLVFEFQECCCVFALDNRACCSYSLEVHTLHNDILKPSNDKKELHNMFFRSRYYLQMCC